MLGFLELEFGAIVGHQPINKVRQSSRRRAQRGSVEAEFAQPDAVGFQQVDACHPCGVRVLVRVEQGFDHLFILLNQMLGTHSSPFMLAQIALDALHARVRDRVLRLRLVQNKLTGVDRLRRRLPPVIALAARVEHRLGLDVLHPVAHPRHLGLPLG